MCLTPDQKTFLSIILLMFTYLKYLEDNLNNKYLKEFEEYRKYLKIYYSENSKCPVDSKTLLLKK